MSPENLAIKGQISIEKARRLNLDAEASGILATLRLHLRVGQEPVNVPFETVEAMTGRLGKVLTELKALDKSIKQLEDALV